METKDLESHRGKFVSNRYCNPLDPVYKVPQYKGPPIQLGPIDGNWPRSHLSNPKIENKGNRTDDIRGAEPKHHGTIPMLVAE